MMISISFDLTFLLSIIALLTALTSIPDKQLMHSNESNAQEENIQQLVPAS